MSLGSGRRPPASPWSSRSAWPRAGGGSPSVRDLQCVSGVRAGESSERKPERASRRTGVEDRTPVPRGEKPGSGTVLPRDTGRSLGDRPQGVGVRRVGSVGVTPPSRGDMDGGHDPGAGTGDTGGRRPGTRTLTRYRPSPTPLSLTGFVSTSDASGLCPTPSALRLSPDVVRGPNLGRTAGLATTLPPLPRCHPFGVPLPDFCTPFPTEA